MKDNPFLKGVFISIILTTAGLSFLNLTDRFEKEQIEVIDNLKTKHQEELINCRKCTYVYLDTTRILYEFEQFDMDTSLVYIIGSYKNTVPNLAPDCVYKVGQNITNWVGPKLPIFEKYAYIPDQFLKN